MRAPIFLALALVSTPALGATPQEEVAYELSFDPGERTWDVEVRFPAATVDGVDFWIARWTAGAYHVAEYGRFARDLVAMDSAGEALEVERVDDSHWEIAAKAGKAFVVRYQADSISSGQLDAGVFDVEANRIREDYAYLTPVSLLGFVPGFQDLPVTLGLDLPEGWRTATSMVAAEDGRYRAADWFRLEDSPLMFSPRHHTGEFMAGGKPHYVSVLGKDAEESQRITEGCQRIVEASLGFMQDAPYERYHFLLGFVPEGAGSGLEHSDSTLILVSPQTSSKQENNAFWSVIAHEFFHLWCAERIHVQELERPDYTAPFKSSTLWVNEGMTEYMTRHILLQSGMMGRKEFLASFTDPIPPLSVVGTPEPWTKASHNFTGAEDLSGLMPFVLHHYMHGPRAILALDLEMRRVSGGERGILDLLRLLNWGWVKRGRGFAEDEVPGLIDAVAQADMAWFYERHIAGLEAPDLEHALEVIGYSLEGGKSRRLEGIEAEQLSAREDFFSPEGSAK